VAAAAIAHPHALAVLVGLDADRRAHLAAGGKLRPAVIERVGIGRAVGVVALRVGALTRHRDERDAGDAEHHGHGACMLHGSPPCGFSVAPMSYRPQFLTYFIRRWRPTSAPKTLPCASAATPSAALVVLTFSTGSGMNAVTSPVRALPTRMPRFQPTLRPGEISDSESAT